MRLEGRTTIVTGAARYEPAAWREEACSRRCGTVRAYARPDEIAGMAVFPAGKDDDYLVAQTYNVDGGNRMS